MLAITPTPTCPVPHKLLSFFLLLVLVSSEFITAVQVLSENLIV